MIFLFDFIHNDSASTAIEYALIAALIFIVIIGAVTSLGQRVLDLYNSVVQGFM